MHGGRGLADEGPVYCWDELAPVGKWVERPLVPRLIPIARPVQVSAMAGLSGMERLEVIPK